MQGWRLQGCKIAGVRFGKDKTCKVTSCGLQSSRLQGCKAAGDKLCTARLQAPGLQSGSAVLLRFDMRKNATRLERQPLQRAKPTVHSIFEPPKSSPRVVNSTRIACRRGGLTKTSRNGLRIGLPARKSVQIERGPGKGHSQAPPEPGWAGKRTKIDDSGPMSPRTKT